MYYYNIFASSTRKYVQADWPIEEQYSPILPNGYGPNNNLFFV